MATYFSNRTDWASEENPLSQKIAELKRRGIALLDLTASNPARCGFHYADESLLSALIHEKNLDYDPNPRGLVNAREAIAGYYAAKNIRVTPEQIFLTSSTSEAYNFIFRLLANPGDNVLIPQPSYPLIDYLAAISDVELKKYALRYADRWRTDFDSLTGLADTRTKAILLVHPNNPTGHYVCTEDIRALTQLSAKQTLPLVVDEVFFDFPIQPDLTPRSFAANHESLIFTVSGISKCLGLPQMKLSWIVVTGPEKIRGEAIRRLEIIADTFLSVSAPVQNALPVWFEKRKEIVSEIRERLALNLKTLKKEASKWKGVLLLKPEGGWYAMLKLPDSKTDEAWTLEILEKTHVLIHPGYLFDSSEESLAVLSLLTDPAIFKTALSSLQKHF